MAKKKVQSKTRRANNEGSIFQRSNGIWCGAITIGYDDNGKQKKKIVYGRSRMEVEQKLMMYNTRIKTNSFDKLENSTASELMEEWIKIFKRNTILPRTYQSQLMQFRIHIKPYLKDLHIQDVDDMVIQQILNRMIDRDYSLSMVKKVKFLFNQFLDYAEESKWIPYNPAHKVKVRIKDKKSYSGQSRYKALPPEKREEFLKALNDDPRKYMKSLCYTIMFSGLRIGEVLGLQWKNVDLKNKTITVEQAVTLMPMIDSNGELIKFRSVVGGPKTACSVREVPIPDILVETLYEWMDKQAEYSRIMKKNFIGEDSYVFSDDNGSYRTYSSCRLAFDRFKKAHGFSHVITFHGLRHTFSNMLFEAQENPKVIQQLLGHKDVRTTIMVYNSVDKNYIRQSTDRLNEKFKVENPKYINRPNISKEQIVKEQEEEEKFSEFTDEELERELRLRRMRKQKDFEM